MFTSYWSKTTRYPPYTPISDGRDALKLLSSEDIQILSKPLYKIKLPYRQMCSINMTEDCSTKYIPIISFQENKIIFNGAFYGDIMIYKNQEAKKAMDNFVLALKKVMLKEILTPGEMVCIDNRAVYHSRTMFDAKFDNLGRAYRWIQRLFITEDLNSFSDYDLKGKRSFTVKFD